MADVFYSVSPFGTGNIRTGTPTMTMSGGVATLSVAQTGNIGIGCRVTYDTSKIAYIAAVNSPTELVLVTVIGGTPGDEGSSVTVDSIAHEYASLSAFEAGYLDADHTNNVDLTAANITPFACHYYDHDDQTEDTTSLVVDGATTDATYFLTILTPQGGTESINNQRHSGVWDTTKARLVGTSGNTLEINDRYVEVYGLQVSGAGGSLNRALIFNEPFILIDKSIFRIVDTSRRAVQFNDNSCLLRNSLVYGATREGLFFNGVNGTVQNVTVVDNGRDGIAMGSAAVVLTNVLAENNGDQVTYWDMTSTGSPTVTYCATGDVTGDDWGGAGNRISQTFTFDGVDDWHLDSGDAGALGYGIDMSGTYTEDIDGDTFVNWSIGMDDGPAVGGVANDYYYRMNQ